MQSRSAARTLYLDISKNVETHYLLGVITLECRESKTQQAIIENSHIDAAFMAELKTLHLAHLPPSLAVHVALYQDVKNAVFLRQQLLAGNPEFEYALIDASMVGAQSTYAYSRWPISKLISADYFHHACSSSSLQSCK